MRVTLRNAIPADMPSLDRLAQLDSSPLPPGPHLVAERDGRIDAALSLSNRELIADPFRHTAELGELLRCHADELRLRGDPTSAAPEFWARVVMGGCSGGVAEEQPV
jgi:hypothetical protein